MDAGEGAEKLLVCNMLTWQLIYMQIVHDECKTVASKSIDNDQFAGSADVFITRKLNEILSDLIAATDKYSIN